MAAVEALRYRWRDDGILLFELSIEDHFHADVEAYFQAANTSVEALEQLVMADAARYGPIDRIARPLQRNFLQRFFDRLWRRPPPSPVMSQERFLHAVYSMASVKAASFIRRQTGHVDVFHKSRAFAKNRHLDGIFLQIRPVRVAFDAAKLSDHVGAHAPEESEALAKALSSQFPFLHVLPFDCALTRLSRYGNVGVNDRGALFALRRAFANMVDACMLVLPNLRRAHVFGQRLFRVAWPWNFMAAAIALTIGGNLLANFLASKEIAPNLLGPAHRPQLAFAWWMVVVMAYAHLEYYASRLMVIRALERTVGALQFGEILAKAIATISVRAKCARSPDGGSAWGNEGSSLVERVLQMEKEKRDSNREVFAVWVGIVAAVFGIAAVTNWFQ